MTFSFTGNKSPNLYSENMAHTIAKHFNNSYPWVVWKAERKGNHFVVNAYQVDDHGNSKYLGVC